MADKSDELSKIERELVLQYLRDDNVPVTVTLEEKPQASDASLTDNKTVYNDNANPIPASAMFPVAIPSKHINVLDEGIIVLRDSDRAIKPFLGQQVRVQFYFNRLGLYFITEMKECSQGAALVIPAVIKRIPDSSFKSDYNFKGSIEYSDSIKLECLPLPGYDLFVEPNWSMVDVEKQKEAKDILEKIVMDARQGKASPIGKGLQLFPVCRYLTQENETNLENVQGKAKDIYLIYIDEKKVVFATDDNDFSLSKDCEYKLEYNFSFHKNSKLGRTVKVKIELSDIYTNPKNPEKKCFVCNYTSIMEEDIRFIYERIFKRTY